MKKLFMLASAALMVMSLNSCSSDDNGGGISDAKLVGKWEHNTEKVTAAGQVLQAEQPYSDNEASCSKDYIQFAENGTITFGDYYDSECSLSTDTANWSRDGKEVTVSGGDMDTQTFTVSKLSSTKMTVKYTESLNGVDFVTEYTFTKAAN